MAFGPDGRKLSPFSFEFVFTLKQSASRRSRDQACSRSVSHALGVTAFARRRSSSSPEMMSRSSSVATAAWNALPARRKDSVPTVKAVPSNDPRSISAISGESRRRSAKSRPCRASRNRRESAQATSSLAMAGSAIRSRWRMMARRNVRLGADSFSAASAAETQTLASTTRAATSASFGDPVYFGQQSGSRARNVCEERLERLRRPQRARSLAKSPPEGPPEAALHSPRAIAGTPPP